MKLLVKYNRVNIIATVIVLLISAVCYYFFLSAVLIHQLDKDLKVEEKEIVDYITKNKKLPEAFNYKDEKEEFIELNDNKKLHIFSSNEIFNTQQNEKVLYRQLEFSVAISGKNYKAIIRKSQEETDDLVQLILFITLSIIFLLLLILFFLNRFFLSKLWQPFKHTLQQIKQFNLVETSQINPQQTNVAEFIELNNAILTMTKKINHEYTEIKNFTENASHEIQTPLAIIKSKLEILSQAENLKEEQMNIIQSIYDATNRLSKLNQSLILLTKIDNQQFKETEKVDISELINKHLVNIEELIATKSITITKNIQLHVTIDINEILAEILISNLLINSIKHNVENGIIEITLNNDYFSVSNSGRSLENEPSELFERFKKDNPSTESLGLGLSIVKKICDRYNYLIKYNYSNYIHTTTINF